MQHITPVSGSNVVTGNLCCWFRETALFIFQLLKRRLWALVKMEKIYMRPFVVIREATGFFAFDSLWTKSIAWKNI